MLVTALQQMVNGLADGAGYVLVALGLTLLFGVLRIVNFAHGELYMLGALAAFFVANHLSLPYSLAVVAGTLGVAVLAAVAYGLVFRTMLREKDFGVTFLQYEFPVLLVSLALSIFLLNATLTLFGGDPRIIASPLTNHSITLGPIAIDEQKMLVFVVALVLVVALDRFLRGTRYGKMMRATAQNRDAARLMGIDIGRIYLATMAISGGLAGIAGALSGPIGAVYPDIGGPILLRAFVVVIIGGLGSIWGAVWAGLLLGVVEALGATFISVTFKDAIGFAMVILVLLLRPQGLFALSR